MNLLYKFSLVGALLVMSNFGRAQDPLQIEFATLDSTSVSNGLVDVDVRVSNFSDILATQLIVTWDSLVLEITEVSFISQDLGGLTEASFALPRQTNQGTRGQLAHAWISPDALPKSLPDDHLLFTMRFKAIGEDCSTTEFDLLNTLNFQTEVLNDEFENLGASFNTLPILITGTDCGDFVVSLACNDMIDISLNVFGGPTTIEPEFILEGGPYDFSLIEITPATVDCSDIGETIVVTATHTETGNSCWGEAMVFDQSPPVVVLDSEFTVQLNSIGTPNPLTARLEVKELDEGTYDNCADQSELIFEPAFFDFDCSQLGPQNVVVTVTDNFGNSNQAFTTVNVELSQPLNVACPPNVVVDCGTDINDPQIIDDILGRATGSNGCVPVYEDIQSFDQNNDGDLEDEFPINGIFVNEEYVAACEFGTIARIWSLPGGSSSCRQLIGLNNVGSSFNGETMIDWPYSLDSIIAVDDNDSGACNTRCATVNPDSIEIVYDNNGKAIGANIVIECEEALCEEPFWASSSCSLIGWASETTLLNTESGTKITKTYFVIDACQYVEETGEGLWEWTVNAEIKSNLPDQVDFVIPDLTVEKGQTSCIPIRVNNFQNIESLQGSINWDPDVASFNSIDDFGLPGLSNGSFGLNNTANGQLSFVWFDATTANPASLPDGSAIFNICLNATGDEGSSTLVEMTNNPTSIEITSDGQLIPYQLSQGSLIVGASACDEDLSAPEPYCVSGLVTTELENGFVEIFAIDFDLGSFDNCTASEDLRFTFSNTNPAMDPDFDGRSSSRVFTVDDIPEADAAILLDVYIWDESDNKDFCTVSIDINDDPDSFETVEFVFDNYYQPMGSQLCVPLMVRNFTNVEAAQATIQWDSDILNFTGTQNYVLEGFSEANVNTGQVNEGKLPFVWFDFTGQTPATLGNGDALFEVCFDLIGDQGTESILTLSNDPTLIQVSSAGEGVRPTAVREGSVTILDSSCAFDEMDIAWPPEMLNVFVGGVNSDNILDLMSPDALIASEGLNSSEVYPQLLVDASCESIIGISYTDDLFIVGDGRFQIVRNWFILDWLTSEVYEYVQIIRNYAETGLICDTLPNSAPLGDCDSGHTLDDDVEWPDDLFVADHRISPDELANSLGIEFKDTRPVLTSNENLYDVRYVDFLGELSQTELVIEREWILNHVDVDGLEWHYFQEISVDLTSFGNLVTVNTHTFRPVPDVVLNSDAVTNDEGIAFTEDDISPQRLDQAENGINVRDVLLLQAWILAELELGDVQLMAADLNDDDRVSTLDMVEMERIILGLENDNSTEWHFIDETDAVSTGYAPKGHYIAFKPGDIDDSAELNSGLSGMAADTLIIEDILLNEGESYTVPLYVSNDIIALASELHLLFNAAKIRVNDVFTTQSFENISFNTIGDSLLSMVTKNEALNTALINQNIPILTLEIEALENGTLRNVFGLSEQYDSYILDDNFELIVIDDLFQGEIATGTEDLLTRPLEVYPNPVSDILYINIEEGIGDYRVDVLDMTGQQMMRFKNENSIDMSSLAPGAYMLRVSSDKGIHAKRIIKL
jgi:hypothetical protein